MREHEPKTPPEIAQDIVGLARICVDFSRVERNPHYPDGRRESDVEHSYMLGMVAMGLAMQYFPELDAGKVGQFAYVHDLIELRIGDTPTFSGDPELIADKNRREAAAMPDLLIELRESGWENLARLVVEYEEQDALEARFVRVIDKLMPACVNIINGGVTLYEDWEVRKIDDLKKGVSNRAKVLSDYSRDMSGAIAIRDAVSALMYEQLFDENGEIIQ